MHKKSHSRKSHKRSRSRKSLPPQLRAMNAIVIDLAKSGDYSGNIMKAAAKIYRSKSRKASPKRKVSRKHSRKHSPKRSRKVSRKHSRKHSRK